MNNFKDFLEAYSLSKIYKIVLEYMYPKMFSTDFIFRQQENLVDNQKCQAGFRPLCNKIPLLLGWSGAEIKCTVYVALP